MTSLRPGVVGGTVSTVFSLASTAPAYSMAVSVGLLASLVGGWAPLLLLVAAVPILLVVLCFRELNAAEPDCGTCYAWVSRAFGRRTGWLTGWLTIAACVLVMSNLLQVAALYLFSLLGLDDAGGPGDSRGAQALVGLALLAVMAWLAHRGITVAARVQVVLLGVELLALVWFAAAALSAAPLAGAAVGQSTGPAEHDVLGAALVAVFLYWGWDSSFSVNEESVDPRRTPARAALVAVVVLAVLYAGFTWATLAYAGVERVASVGEGDLLAVLGASLMGSAGGQVLVGAVLFSALASVQTTILPSARSAYAMARAGALPRAVGTVSVHGTPSGATVGFAVLSGAVYLALVLTSDAVLADSVAATAVLVAAYYTVTAAAVPVTFGRLGIARRPLRRLVVPVLAAGTLGSVLVASVIGLSSTSVVVVLGVLAVGVLGLAGVHRLPTRPAPPAGVSTSTHPMPDHRTTARELP